MTWTVVAAADRPEWAAALDRVGCRDPYYLAAYHDAYGYDGGQAFLYVADCGGETLVHPVRLRAIERVGDRPAPPGLCDLETVYGYSGPLATCDDPDFLAGAWRGFDQWCGERRVVSEFCRFHPLLRNERFAHPATAVVRDRMVVAVDLSRGMDAVWAGYQSTQRNRVRKAEAAGLSVSFASYAEAGDDFVRVYDDTMRALAADAFYFFQPAYWRALAALGDVLSVACVHDAAGRTIAAALFLVAGGVVHYHLGGSLADARHLGPNNLLFHRAAAWAAAAGAHTLLLGGGRSNRDDDELLRFKARLSSLRLPFYLGKRVVDRAAYDTLSQDWQNRSGRRPPPVLQHYRLAIAESGES